MCHSALGIDTLRGGSPGANRRGCASVAEAVVNVGSGVRVNAESREALVAEPSTSRLLVCLVEMRCWATGLLRKAAFPLTAPWLRRRFARHCREA